MTVPTTTTTRSRGVTASTADPFEHRHRAPTDRPPSLLRLVEVELRKAVDTRAGAWLLAVIGLMTLTTVVLRLSLGQRSDRTLSEVFGMSQLSVSLLVPVLGILLVTGEWSQGTALTTFTLVPHRNRVIGAKLLAVMTLAVLASLAGLAASLAGFGVASGFGVTQGGWSLGGTVVATSVLFQVLNVLMGAAAGLLLLNSAAAIAIYFALPTVWSIAGQLVPGLRTPAEWLDSGRTMQPLVGAVDLTGRQWEQLGTSVALWVLLPLVLGVVRLRRREIA